MSWTLRSALSTAVLALLLFTLASSSRAQWFAGNLKATTNRADYVIITTKDFAPVVAPLATFRASRNGFVVVMVLMDSVAAQFRRATPDSSLRDLMEVMTKDWQVPHPRFCLLAGAVDRVPSHALKSPFPPDLHEDSVLVDQWLVTPSGSTAPYPPPLLALGRMPAWDAGQLQVAVQKTIAYEQAEPGPWARRAIALADSVDADYMESEAAEYQKKLAPAWPDTIPVHLRPTSPFYRSSAGFRTLWGEGSAFVSFIGHQNWRQFSRPAYFTPADADSLSPRSELPVCLMLGGQRFDHPDTISIAAALLKAPGRGAVCVVAPVGISYFFSVGEFSRALFAYLASHGSDPIGVAWKATLSSGTSEIDRRWMIFGDPALVVKRADLAAVNPPAGTPDGFALHQNYPNPFNPSTTIRFTVPATSFVTIRVFNTLGQEVATLHTGMAKEGLHELRFDASGLATGLYLCRMQAGSFVGTTKMMLVR